MLKSDKHVIPRYGFAHDGQTNLITRYVLLVFAYDGHIRYSKVCAMLLTEKHVTLMCVHCL